MGKMLIVLALVVAGCGDDGAHEMGDCGPTWSGSLGCEAACYQRPNMTGPSCRATCTVTGDGPCRDSMETVGCGSTFTVDGATGCCVEAGGPDRRYVLFLECVD